jgi:hypothetical protein
MPQQAPLEQQPHAAGPPLHDRALCGAQGGGWGAADVGQAGADVDGGCQLLLSRTNDGGCQLLLSRTNDLYVLGPHRR